MPSIPPRLDEYDHRLDRYNAMISRVVKELGVEHIENSEEFEKRKSWLWSSRDSVHLSTNYGVPLYLKAIRRSIGAMSHCVYRETESDT